MNGKVMIEVDRDGLTGQLQLSISHVDENGVGLGHRLAGPKFNGSSETVLSRTLDARDASEIRTFLDAVFPEPDDEDDTEAERALDEYIRGDPLA